MQQQAARMTASSGAAPLHGARLHRRARRCQPQAGARAAARACSAACTEMRACTSAALP